MFIIMTNLTWKNFFMIKILLQKLILTVNLATFFSDIYVVQVLPDKTLDAESSRVKFLNELRECII